MRLSNFAPVVLALSLAVGGCTAAADDEVVDESENAVRPDEERGGARPITLDEMRGVWTYDIESLTKRGQAVFDADCAKRDAKLVRAADLEFRNTWFRVEQAKDGVSPVSQRSELYLTCTDGAGRPQTFLLGKFAETTAMRFVGVFGGRSTFEQTDGRRFTLERNGNDVLNRDAKDPLVTYRMKRMGKSATR